MNGTRIYSGRLTCVLVVGWVCSGCGASVTPTHNSPPKSADTLSNTAVPSTDKPPAEKALGLLSAELLDDGWISLFDGETLFGWHPTSQADWRVEEGTIVVEKGVAGLLATTTPFADYMLHVEFHCPPGTNSGVFLATQLEPGNVATDCYELNIAGPDNPFPTGSLVQRQAVKEDLNRDGLANL